MLEQFSGYIHSGTTAALPAPAAELARLAFARGMLAHRSAHTVYERDGLLSLVAGTPRFDDPAVHDTAIREGAAAAWAQAWASHGEAALNGMHGRFCVVMVATDGSRALLASDRFATWPVCYRADAHGLAFADRADRVPATQRTISTQAIFEYLFFHAIPAPLTIFDGIARLPGGHLLHWQNGQASCRPWWTPRFAEPGAADFATARERFLQIIDDGVRREADGHQVGAFLSGGTDSSTVAGMLGRALDAPARCYSIGFDASGYDEMEYARIAARHFGVDHREYYVTPDDLLDGIPRVATHYDQPFGNSSAVPAWICASRAREDGIDKLLAGDGGDELFGGNTRYAKQRVFGVYDGIPAALRRGVLEPLFALPGVGRAPLLKKGASYIEQARVPMPDRLQMYNMLLRLGMDTVFEASFLATVDRDAPLRDQRAVWQAAEAETLINRMLAYDWKYTLADNDLPKVIGSTQLAGIDVGFPLLSDELVDFSTSLPPQWKLKGLTLRWFFKEALRGFLPDAIITKKKHGFGLPFGVWACQHDGLGKLAADALGSLRGRGIVRPAFLDDLLAIHLPAHPGYYGEMVWILMMLEFWLREHQSSNTGMAC